MTVTFSTNTARWYLNNRNTNGVVETNTSWLYIGQAVAPSRRQPMVSVTCSWCDQEFRRWTKSGAKRTARRHVLTAHTFKEFALARQALREEFDDFSIGHPRSEARP